MEARVELMNVMFTQGKPGKLNFGTETLRPRRWGSG